MTAASQPVPSGRFIDPGHVPLAAFTILAIGGAGMVAAGAAAAAAQAAVSPALFGAGAALLAMGLAVSLTHLGRRERVLLAARGAGRSPLSNEAIAAAAAIGCAGLAAAAAFGGAPGLTLSMAAGAACAVFLLSVGFVYGVRGQLTWRGFAALTPLTGGCAFGAVVVQALVAPGPVMQGTLAAVAIDALVFAQRWRAVVALRVPAPFAVGPWWRRRHEWLAARVFLLDVVPFFLLSTSPSALAAVAAAAGLVVDRLAFYGLALPHTTEYEVAVAEQRLDEVGAAVRSEYDPHRSDST